ncbi:MAG: hypothetical protein AB1938_30555 [Myxococcota bacterium]
MGTTSLKLSDRLRKRVSKLAKKDGVTPHAFMVQAIEGHAEARERQRAFLDDAKAAEAEMEASGEGYAMADVHAWLEAKAAGRPARRPRARVWR